MFRIQMLYYNRLILFSLISAINCLFSAANNLIGSIPAELSDLMNLVSLVLGKSFKLPRTVYNTFRIPMLYYNPLILFSYVATINRLFSENNQLTGSIPAELGKLKELTLLNLRKSFELPRTSYNMFRSQMLYYIQLTNAGFLCCRNQSFIFRGKSAFRQHSCGIRRFDEFGESEAL